MTELLNRILQIIQSIPWGQLRDFLRDLFLKQKFALLTFCFLFVISAALLYFYDPRSNEYEKVMKTTLEADLERTPQRFKNWCLSKTVVISRGVSSEGKISLSLFENETYIVASETNTWEERSSEGC